MRFAISCIIAVLLAVLSMHYAHAGQRVWKDSDGDWIRLFDGPCVHGKTLSLLPETKRQDFKKATSYIGGKMYYACWTSLPDGRVYFVDEDGDAAIFNSGSFKDEPGV